MIKFRYREYSAASKAIEKVAGKAKEVAKKAKNTYYDAQAMPFRTANKAVGEVVSHPLETGAAAAIGAHLGGAAIPAVAKGITSTKGVASALASKLVGPEVGKAIGNSVLSKTAAGGVITDKATKLISKHSESLYSKLRKNLNKYYHKATDKTAAKLDSEYANGNLQNNIRNIMTMIGA